MSRPESDYDPRNGVIVECVNPQHLWLGPMHYLERDCIESVDSDESWQASEALLRK